ncbi:MAG: hypothetical protein VKI81_09355 [Synechococcaceae cyanobacterium]|nr:hypothetical protein [Synechococcaceae cyanobacterium]
MNAELRALLSPEGYRSLSQLEAMVDLARDAAVPRDIEHYRELLLDLEERLEESHELHGFLRSSIALLDALPSGEREPFPDALLIREFAALALEVQARIVADLWAEDPGLASRLDRFRSLGPEEKAAFLLWLAARAQQAGGR